MISQKNKFTLIELIVVIAVIGILSSIVIPNISNMNEKAKVAAVESNERNIQTAVDMFYLDYGYYPCDKQPEFTEDEDNPDNLSGFLVGREDINFDKDNFVTDYLRETPTDGVTYTVDAWGIVNSDLDITDGEGNIPNPPIPPISKDKIKISTGDTYSFALLESGKVYSWGANISGQLGLGNKTDQSTPQLVTFFNDKKVREIKLFGSRSIAILETGEIYGWGYNLNGELGLGNNTNQITPQLITFFNDKKVKDIKLGLLHSIAILENGEVYSWGYNLSGGLGIGNNTNQRTPQLVEFFNDKKVKDIELGAYFSIAILENGEVYSWGNNSFGQLGLGHKIDQNGPQLVEFFNGMKVKKIELGHYHSFAILENGEVYSWGKNHDEELGIGNVIDQTTPQLVEFFNDKKVKEINLGELYSLALLESGQVYSWGNNAFGQLGLGTQTNQSPPQLVEAFNGKKVKSVKAARLFSLAILESGELYSWGGNNLGQLGLGTQTNQSTPQLVTFFNDKVEE